MNQEQLHDLLAVALYVGRLKDVDSATIEKKEYALARIETIAQQLISYSIKDKIINSVFSESEVRKIMEKYSN